MIISGGQSGVDRAALDAALEGGLRCSGWCPKGRRAEDGAIAARYPLRETPLTNYVQRTEWNVRDAQGTLILTRGHPSGGTAQTIRFAAQRNQPCLIVDLATRRTTPSLVCGWLRWHRISVLNVAGPRESKAPGIYRAAKLFLHKVLAGADGVVSPKKNAYDNSPRSASRSRQTRSP